MIWSAANTLQPSMWTHRRRSLFSRTETRIARLEARQPRSVAVPRFLTTRDTHSWLPRGIHRLTAKQSQIFMDPSRFRVVVAGRRSGKSFLAVTELLRAAR